MLKKEIVTIEGTEFSLHHSDAGMMIRKVGTDEEYEEALDIVPCQFEYEETDEPIEKEDDEFIEG